MARSYGMRPGQAGLLLCLGLLCACSVAPADVASGPYQPASPSGWSAGPSNARPQPPSAPVATCNLYLQPIVDLRADKVDMGTAGGRVVHGEDMAGWLTSAITYLQAQGFRVDTQGNTDDRLVMHVEILKAYMHDTWPSIAASIVVRVGYARADGGVLDQQLYRGDSSSADWVASDREIDRDFRLATEDLLQQLAPDLGRHCVEAAQPVRNAGSAPQK